MYDIKSRFTLGFQNVENIMIIACFLRGFEESGGGDKIDFKD
jgi:hypothetical protein